MFYVIDSELLAGIDIRSVAVTDRDAAARLSRGAEELFRYVQLPCIHLIYIIPSQG